jgi:hypothetical protein
MIAPTHGLGLTQPMPKPAIACTKKRASFSATEKKAPEKEARQKEDLKVFLSVNLGPSYFLPEAASKRCNVSAV